MNCKEYQELISASLDGELSAEEQRDLDFHMSSCAECRAAFEVESSIKKLVKERISILQTPPAVVQRIMNGLNEGQHAAALSWRERFQEFLSRPLVRPAIAIAVTAVLLFALLNRAPDVDFLQRSVDNFKSVAGGSTAFQEASGEPAVLKALFAEQAAFPVLVPEMQGCTLLGGALDKHPGGVFAHVVYYHGMKAKKVYLCEVSWDKVLSEDGMTLNDDVRGKLESANYYSNVTPERTVILWRKGTTLCAAVSNMPEPDLVMCITSIDPAIMQK